ncbi:hypothetical protein BVRB_025870, partial [Beta vulgaris subsp. vulgaris]
TVSPYSCPQSKKLNVTVWSRYNDGDDPYRHRKDKVPSSLSLPTMNRSLVINNPLQPQPILVVADPESNIVLLTFDAAGAAVGHVNRQGQASMMIISIFTWTHFQQLKLSSEAMTNSIYKKIPA